MATPRKANGSLILSNCKNSQNYLKAQPTQGASEVYLKKEKGQD